MYIQVSSKHTINCILKIMCIVNFFYVIFFALQEHRKMMKKRNEEKEAVKIYKEIKIVQHTLLI